MLKKLKRKFCEYETFISDVQILICKAFMSASKLHYFLSIILKIFIPKHLK